MRHLGHVARIGAREAGTGRGVEWSDGRINRLGGVSVAPPSGRPEPDPAVGVAPNGRRRESVWDYPRPPRIENEARRVTVAHGGETIVDTGRAVRVLETAGAPTIYVPPGEVADGALRTAHGSSYCEWKGAASYFDVVAGGATAERAAWAYPQPKSGFERIAGWVSFYPALVECRLDDEPVEPQPGGFYGGWVTAEITGPIKGAPGSMSW
jgi:uncharacterized protein (DUF427 family)